MLSSSDAMTNSVILQGRFANCIMDQLLQFPLMPNAIDKFKNIDKPTCRIGSRRCPTDGGRRQRSVKSELWHDLWTALGTRLPPRAVKRAKSMPRRRVRGSILQVLLKIHLVLSLIEDQYHPEWLDFYSGTAAVNNSPL